MKNDPVWEEGTKDDLESSIKLPKSSRIKLLKELNYKANSAFHETKTIEIMISSLNKKDVLVSVERSRMNRSGGLANSTKQLSLLNRSSYTQLIKGVKLDGQVSFKDQNDNKFIGVYKKGIRVSGKMVYSEAKCEYQGQFLGQKFHGHGKLTYYNGRIIQGQWESQILVGNAFIYYPNEDVYYGQVNDKLYKHGEGHLFFKNGDKYIGQFKNGSISGYGTYYSNDIIASKGIWLKGRFVRQTKSDDIHQSSDTHEQALQQIYKISKQKNITKKCLNQQKSKTQSTCKLNNTQIDSGHPFHHEQSGNKSQNLDAEKIRCLMFKFLGRKKQNQIMVTD